MRSKEKIICSKDLELMLLAKHRTQTCQGLIMIALWKFKKSRRVLGQDPHLHLYVVLLLTHLPMTNKMIKLLVCVCNLAHSEHRLHNTQKTRRRSFLGECKDDDFQQKTLVTLCNVCPFNSL